MSHMHPSNAELLHAVDLSALGGRLRAARVAKGWTQADLAGEEISVGYVSRIESGSRRPNLAVLTNLASRLGAPIEQLLQGVTANQYDEIRLGLDYAELALESGEGFDAERQAQKFLGLAVQASLADLTTRGRYLFARALEANGDVDAAIIQLEHLVGEAPGQYLIPAGIASVRCYKRQRRLRARDRGRRATRDRASTRLASTVPTKRSSIAVNLAGAYILRGDLHKAARICADAVRRADELDLCASASGAYWNASLVTLERGDVADRRPHGLPRARAPRGRQRRPQPRPPPRAVGELQLQLDPPEIEDARANFQGTGRDGVIQCSEIDVAITDVHIAQTHLMSGDPEQALDMAIPAEESAGDRAFVATRNLGSPGAGAGGTGPTDEAHESYVDAMHVLTAAGADRSVAQLWFELADLMEDAGDMDGAREAYRSAAATTGLTSRRRAGPARSRWD